MLKDNFITDLHLVSSQISNLINTPIEQNFERLARMTKRMFDVPVIAISLYDEKRQLVKPVVSLDLEKFGLFMPFFNEFSTDEVLVVEDTTKNDLFKNHELVVQDPNIRFFVSFPIFEKNGKKIGSLLMLDYRPRSFGLTDLTNLNDIVKLVETEIRDFRISKAQKLFLQEISNSERTQFIDPKTRAWNFEGFKKLLQYQLIESNKEKSYFALATVDIDNLGEINQKYGEAVGDELLTLTSRTILRSCRDEDTIARGDDEDFLVIIQARNPDHVKTVVNRIKSNIEKEEVNLSNNKFSYNVTIGVTFYKDEINSETLIQNSKIALLKGKRYGRNRIEFN